MKDVKARKVKSLDEICEEQLQKARNENLPQPNFDFRNDYFKGQLIYYIKVNEFCGKKDIMKLKISTVYPRLIVAHEEQGVFHYIGFSEADMIFFTLAECERVFINLEVENKLEEYIQRQNN